MVKFIDRVGENIKIGNEQYRAKQPYPYPDSILYDSDGKECYNNCEELGLKYFKFKEETALFGADIVECFCVKDNKTKRIW